jgi:hypothetical protein
MIRKFGIDFHSTCTVAWPYQYSYPITGLNALERKRVLDDALYDVAVCWIVSHVIISTCCTRSMGKSCGL